MRQWFVVGILASLILFLTLITAGYVYYSLGLKEYTDSIIAIKSLPKAQSDQAWSDYFVNTLPNTYSGILAGVWNGQVWLWGSEGPKSFKLDQDTVYIFYSACSQENIAQPQANQALTRKISIDPAIGISFSDWSEKIKKGDYVTVATAAKGAGGKPGNAREIYTYDWQVFLPNKKLQETCVK